MCFFRNARYYETVCVYINMFVLFCRTHPRVPRHPAAVGWRDAPFLSTAVMPCTFLSRRLLHLPSTFLFSVWSGEAAENTFSFYTRTHISNNQRAGGARIALWYRGAPLSTERPECSMTKGRRGTVSERGVAPSSDYQNHWANTLSDFFSPFSCCAFSSKRWHRNCLVPFRAPPVGVLFM